MTSLTRLQTGILTLGLILHESSRDSVIFILSAWLPVYLPAISAYLLIHD
uniref:Uncharacterized protein n=1 Tax=Anguilla anguilla TaxID=7936 RepID=A0A0E9SJZ0_ANGAN